MIIRKSAQEIELMARAGAVVAETLALLEERLEPGISMAELDRIADDYIHARGGVPTSKGYKGFPAATCISPNEMIVHGIPGDYRARGGRHRLLRHRRHKDGMIADSAATFPVGEIWPRPSACSTSAGPRSRPASRPRASAPTSATSRHAVQTWSRTPASRSSAASSATGSATSYHEDPQVPNFVLPYRGPELREGMTLAIEPMITAGGPDVYVHDDDWSISTVDGSLAAHFEHTVAITADGPRVLTRPAQVLVP